MLSTHNTCPKQIYKDVTLFFSQDSAATVAHIIPTMDCIDKILCKTGTTALTPSEKVQDPIAWWWDHRNTYPKLLKMAFDYLSIPHEYLVLCCM
jgi:hypothetical protein